MCYYSTEQWEEVAERLVEEELEEEFKEDRKERIDEDEQIEREPAPADD